MALLLSCFSLFGQEPELVTDPDHGEYCAGEAGVMLIATGLDAQTYQLEKWDDNTEIWVSEYTITLNVAGDYDFNEAPWEAGEYRLHWEENGTPGTSFPITITKKSNPQVFTLQNASDDCSPVEPYLTNSQNGVTYRLLLNGVEVALEEGIGGLLNFDEQTGHGTYTAEAFYETGAQCMVEMNGSFEAFSFLKRSLFLRPMVIAPAKRQK